MENERVIIEIFIARAWDNNIEVSKFKVLNQTEKQFKLSTGKRINKSLIGACDSAGNGYGLTKDQAIETVKARIQSEINKYENWAQHLKNKINYPIKELYE